MVEARSDAPDRLLSMPSDERTVEAGDAVRGLSLQFRPRGSNVAFSNRDFV